MRIADKMTFDQVTSNLTKNRSDMSELQNQAATQKKLTKPSDDPLAATRVLATRSDISGGQQFMKSIGQAKAFLEYSDQSLGELTDILSRAKELAISQSSDASASKATREVTATEIGQLFSQAVQVGNRKQGDRFLFGGFKTTRAPFDSNGGYRGDSGEIKISINKEASVAMNIPGSRIFLGESVLTPSTAGPRKSGSEANGSRADMRRPTRPDTTPDTANLIRGPANTPNSFNDSIKEDVETAPDESQSNLGDMWRSKGVNVFKVLSDLEIGLRSNDKESVQESLDRLDEALAQVVLSRSQLGARVGTLNSASESLSKGQVDSKALVSGLEDADTFELVSELNKTESTLKASLSTSGKLIQPSLLDFLR